jgi:subtilisin family serine protease
VDAYIAGYGIEPQFPDGGFDPSCATPGKQIDTPGSASCAITVGSYDFNDLFHVKGDYHTIPVNTGRAWVEMVVGSRSAYSNPGYRRLGQQIKPEIVAPGQYFTAAAPPKVKGLLYDTSGNYQLFNGTSAATPYTAGVVALLMQKKRDITLGEIKKLLQKHAASDKYTGEVPNPEWGYGKLTRKAVVEMIKALE